MTEVQAANLIAALATAFPDGMRFLAEDQQQATQKLYRHMMRDLDQQACAQACARIVATGKKFPSIAEIREATELQSSGRADLGLEAWGRVQKAIARHGRNARIGIDVKFKDDVYDARNTRIGDGPTARTVDAIGWKVLCDEDNPKGHAANRARFIELYDQLARQAHHDAVAGEICAPIPRKQLHGGPRSLAAIVGDLLPKESQP